MCLKLNVSFQSLSMFKQKLQTRFNLLNHSCKNLKILALRKQKSAEQTNAQNLIFNQQEYIEKIIKFNIEFEFIFIFKRK